VDYRWQAANNNWWYPKILTLSYYERWRLLITSYRKYLLIMEIRYDLILFSKSGNESSDAGRRQGRNEVRWRPGQEVWRPPNLRFGSKSSVLKKVLAALLGLFCAPAPIRRPGNCAPLPTPRYAPGRRFPTPDLNKRWFLFFRSACTTRATLWWNFQQLLGNCYITWLSKCLLRDGILFV